MKLLSDKELEKLLFDFSRAIAYKQMSANKHINSLYQMGDKSSIDVVGLIKSLVSEINTQKRLYAEIVIGEDERPALESSPLMKYLSPNTSRIDWRNGLRAEQRARIK